MGCRGVDASAFPLADAVKCGEQKGGRGAAFAAEQFSAAPHIVLHPGRQAQMIGVAPDFAGVQRQRVHQGGDIVEAGFNEQVRRAHLSPKFGLHQRAGKTLRQSLERIHHEKVRADVRGMMVVIVWGKNHARLVILKDGGDDVYGDGPGFGILFARLNVDVVQTAGCGLFQFEAESGAGKFQFSQACGSAFRMAAKSDSNVHDAHTRFLQQPQGQGAGDAFVVRMRGKDERDGRVSREVFPRARRSLRRYGFALPEQFGGGRDKISIGIHSVPWRLAERRSGARMESRLSSTIM